MGEPCWNRRPRRFCPDPARPPDGESLLPPSVRRGAPDTARGARALPDRNCIVPVKSGLLNPSGGVAFVPLLNSRPVRFP